MTKCANASSGCDYPSGDCAGYCHFPVKENAPPRRPAAPHYLTIVYRITEPQQPRALLEHAEWRAASHTHAIQERDSLSAELNDVQAQRSEAFRAIERLNDELGQACEQRDKLLEAILMLTAKGPKNPPSGEAYANAVAVIAATTKAAA